MRDFDVLDVRWVERNSIATANLGDPGPLNKQHILKPAPVLEHYCACLISHAGFRFVNQKLAKLIWQRRVAHGLGERPRSLARRQ